MRTPTSLWLAVLAILITPGPLAAQRAAWDVAPGLAEKDPDRRGKAAAELRRYGEAARKVLQRMLAPDLAAQPAEVPSATRARVAALIVRLGARRYADRQAAHETLARIGADAKPQLEQATRSADIEVATRARALLRALRPANAERVFSRAGEVHAALLLSVLGTKESIPALKRVIGNREAAPGLRAAATFSLSAIATPDASERSVVLRHTPDGEQRPVRQTARYVLLQGRLRHPDAEPWRAPTRYAHTVEARARAVIERDAPREMRMRFSSHSRVYERTPKSNKPIEDRPSWRGRTLRTRLATGARASLLGGQTLTGWDRCGHPGPGLLLTACLPGGTYRVGQARPLSTTNLDQLAGIGFPQTSLGTRITDRFGRLTYLGLREGRDVFSLAAVTLWFANRDDTGRYRAVGGTVSYDSRGRLVRYRLSGMTWLRQMRRNQPSSECVFVGTLEQTFDAD